MIDVVEESFNIEVYYVIHMLYLYQSHTLCDGVFSGSVRTESVRIITEFGLTYRLHDL